MVRKKILLLLVTVVIIPIMLLTIAANKTGQQAQEKVMITTLETGMKIVRGEMQERKNGMRRVCNFLASSSQVQKAVLNKDTNYLSLRIGDLKNYFEYVDYVVVVNKNNGFLAKLAPDMRYASIGKLGKLVRTAMYQRRVIFSEELIPLDELFVAGSKDYDKFLVSEKNIPDISQHKTIRQAMISLAIVPIYRGGNVDDVIGAIVVGDIFNNDTAFPNNVSTYSDDAIVLASTGGIRVASNFAKEGGKDFIGTAMAKEDPETPNTKKLSPHYLSTLNIAGTPYKIMNEVLYDSTKAPIGFLGVGLPETSYYTLNAADDRLFIMFSLLALVMLAFSVCYVQHYLKDSEGEKEAYRHKIKEAYSKQLYLTNELRHLNSKLEAQVQERTQHLATVIEKLKQADEVRTRFMAGLSHELRTPLNIIISSAQVLQDQLLGPLNPKQENYAKGIYSSGEHLLSLINNLLSMSKLEFGKEKLQFTSFCLKNLVEEVVRNVRKYDPDKHLNITVGFVESGLCIEADMQKLRQIIYNLMSNAVKFTPAGGQIAVKTARDGAMVRITVEDNGVGMSKEDLAKVFKEFEQGKNASKVKYTGSGLGLAIVKYLVEQHGGTVYLESELQKGCKVTVLLPMSAREYLAERKQVKE
ncbi:MAG: ATP-binding protein [Acidaminococcaceae bacterium]|jgi:signal transduction histidine kinase|nr:ATP-binding protein [Acidaminococcaceae bacterium]MCI2110244.1 ATP-binding protein [Acidaminococcaceae bacterium]